MTRNRATAADGSAQSSRFLYSMAEGYKPSQQTSGYYEQHSGTGSPRGRWIDQKGSSGSAGQSSQPPPGSRTVSAYSSSPTHQADFAHSTLNLVTCVLGAGALGYPFCFKECGLLLATIIMFATLVATRISYQLLLYCAQLSGRKSYESIAEYALGNTGRQIVELCIAAMNLGALVAFLDILADVLSAVAGTVIPPGAEPSRHAYITGVTLLGALPVSLVVREPSVIANMSNAAVVFVVVFAVVVFCTAFGPSAAAALGVRWAALTHDSRVAAAAAAVKVPVLHMWNPQGVLVSLPVMAYGFTAHQYYMGIYTMLKAPTIRKMKLVTDAALLICAGVYWTVGVGGYATFGDRTAGDIIRNFGGQRAVGFWGAYERALKLCYGMAVLGNIPLVILPFSSILSPLLPGDEKLKQQTSSLTGACTVAGAKRCTAAALSGCGSGSGALMQAQKARFSGSGGGSSRQPLSDGGSKCAGGELAVQLDTEALVLEAPTWQRHSEHDTVHGSSNGSSDQEQQWRQQQQLLLLRTQAQLQREWETRQQVEQQQEQQPLLREGRAGSPEEAPEHPHLTRDAARAAHMLTGPQHTLVVVLVLGLGLASAVWLPNVELIFGLTGSTASVLAAFIMPAICFLRLYDMSPELGSGKPGGAAISGGSSFWRALKHAACCCGCCGLGSLLIPTGRSRHRGFGGPRPARHSSPGASRRQYSSNGSSSWNQLRGNGDQGGASSPSKVWGPVLVVPELRAQWACRQRLAFALLAFGLISGLLCTDAILSSISEEKAVVQLAQELVAHEAVVAETSRAQQKAKEAAAAVDAVSSAAQQLGAVDTATNQTLGSLAAAAAALNTIAAPKEGTGSRKGHGGGDKQPAPSVWDLKGRIEQHKQKAAEDSVLRNVEAALSTAAADITATTASVTAVIIKLDTSIAQIKADAAAADAAAAAAPPRAPANSGKDAPLAEHESVKAPDGRLVVPPAAGRGGSSAIVVPHAGGADRTADRTADGSTERTADQQQQPAAPAVVYGAVQAGSGARTSGSSSSSSDAYARANEMARELGQALGTFGKSAAGVNLTLTAGRSLEQVRDSAIAALTALNVTANVLRQVRAAVAAARRAPDSQQRDSHIKDVAIQAMQRALNATAASALAMRITREALGTAATEETSELLTALTRVAQDLEKSDSAAASGGKKRASITVSSDDASKASAAAAAEGGAPAAPTAVMGAHGVWHVAKAGGGGSTAGSSIAGTASDPVQIASSGGVAVAAGAGAADGSRTAADAAATAGKHTSGTEAAGNSSSDGSGNAAAAAAPAAQVDQPLAKHPTLEEHQAAAAAAANAAAHAEAESNTDAPQQQQQQQQGTAGLVTPVEQQTLKGAAPATEKHAQQHPAQDDAAAATATNVAAHVVAGAVQTTKEVAAATAQEDSTATASTGGGSSSGTAAAAAQLAPTAATTVTTTTTSSSSSSSAADKADSSALSTTEASKVKDIIEHLAAALSSGGSSTAAASSSTGSSGGQAGGAAAATANVTQLAAAIRDAVTWTEQSKATVLKSIVKDLGQTDPKVAQRVVSIVQEVGTTESDADREKEQRKAVAAAAAALDAAAVSEDKSKQQQQQQQQHDAAAVAGPVVAVTADGKLQQQSAAQGSDTAGPVVKAAAADTDASTASAADAADKPSSSSSSSSGGSGDSRQQGLPEDTAAEAAGGTHAADVAASEGAAATADGGHAQATADEAAVESVTEQHGSGIGDAAAGTARL